MRKIKELPNSLSHLLSCTQIITSVHCVVKELIENAIDSSSKNVEVKLEDYGLGRIELKDSGTGINKDDIAKIAKPHCTSKISSYLDLNQVRTYGFRGEALAALCAVADLVITTKTAEEEFGFTHTFRRNGEIVSSKPFPCTQGTTVSVLNLFKNIPVRKQYYRTDKVKKDELKKIEDILIAFGCIHPGIRFALYHNRNVIWQKPIVSSVHNGLVAIFGNGIVEHMQNCEFMDGQVSLEVFLPKNNAPPFCGHSSASKSIVSVNERPVRMKVIDKILKDYYNKSVQNFSKVRYPVCYIIIKVPPSEVDVNIEPNKTSVMLHNMDVVTEQLAALLKTFYSNESIIEANEIPNHPTENFNKNKITQEPCMKKSEICVTPFLTSEGQTPNPKNIRASKKLSRLSSDIDSPSTKRIKSSASNDIDRHIKTLDNFLNSPQIVDHSEYEKITKDSLESQTFLTTEPFNTSNVELLINSNMQTDTRISDIQNDVPNNSIKADNSIAPETGKPMKFKPIDKLSDIFNETAEILNSSDNLSSIENVNQNFTNKSNFTLGVNRKNSENLESENRTCCLNNKILETNANLEFKTAKSIMLNKDTISNSLNQFPTKENLNPNPPIDANGTGKDWSRGKESAVNFQWHQLIPIKIIIKLLKF